MQRLLYIAKFEYFRHLRRRMFLLTTFGVPLLLVAGFVLLFAALVLTNQPESAIGYVDQAEVLPADAEALLPAAETPLPVPLRAYPDEAAAREAFVAGDIAAYVVIPPDYLDSGSITAYGAGELSMEGEQSLRTLLRAGLLEGATPQVIARAFDPIETLRRSTLDGGQTIVGGGIWFILLPYLFGMLFLVATFSSSSYLLQAIVEEKENRTMEIVVTSVKPAQLIAGKTLGLGALGLTQALVWLLFGALLAGVGAIFLEPLRTFNLPGDILLIALLAFIPGYLLFAGLMIGIGAMVSSQQEGQQMASMLTLTGMLPFILNFVFVTNPNGALAVGLSLFPLSAPLALVMRLPLAQVPLWQILLSLGLLTASAVLVVLAVGRIFRLGMLHYGKPIRPGELVRLLRAS